MHSTDGNNARWLTHSTTTRTYIKQEAHATGDLACTLGQMAVELPMGLLQAALLLVIGVVTLKLPTIFRYIRVWFSIRKLPSPPGAKLFMGHAAAYSPLAKHRYEETSAKSLGPVYRYRNYTNQIVVVNDPALQQEIFTAEREGAIEKPDQPNGFSKGKGRGEMNVFSEKSGDPMWKLVRKGTASAFAAQNLRNYHHHIVDIVDRLIGGVRSKGPHTAVNIADIAQRESFDVIGKRESFDVIGKVGFGRDFQASKDIDNPVNTFQQLTDDLEEGVHRLIHPWRKYSLSKEKLARDKNHESIRSIYRELVDECLNRPPSADDTNSIAGHLLRLRGSNGKPLSRERLIEEFSIFFVAGSETTGHTVAWTLWFLAQNPAALHQLEEELDAAGLLKTAANPSPRAFTYADISKLHWLDCCIKEAMRLQPVAANSLRRLAVRNVPLSNGVVIPAGVIVELAQYSVFRNPAWGWEDPNAFKPERWEDPEEEYYTARRSSAAAKTGGKGSESEELKIGAEPSSALGSKAKRMHPFGAGIRNCLGQQLAKINVPTAVAMLTREFHLTLAPQTAGKELAELEVLKATLQPRNGIFMLCKPRA